jgi:hypothetical protein
MRGIQGLNADSAAGYKDTPKIHKNYLPLIEGPLKAADIVWRRRNNHETKSMRSPDAAAARGHVGNETVQAFRCYGSREKCICTE